jgi:hypothetical protein
VVALSATSWASDVQVRIRDSSGQLRPDVTLGYSVDGAEALKAQLQSAGTFLLEDIVGSKLRLEVEVIDGPMGIAEVELPPNFDHIAVRFDGTSISAAAIGDWALSDVLGEGSGGGAPGPNGCAAAVSCQISDLMGQGGSGTLAANASGTFEVADNFTATSAGSITSVCIFGIYLNFTTFADCAGTTGDALTITYYANTGGLPGAVIGGPFAVANTRVDTGRNLVVGALSFDEYRLTAAHAAVPLAMGQSVWMGVNNATTAPCAFAWLSAPPGSGGGAQDAGAGFAATDYDLSWCVNASVTGGGGGGGPANDLCADAIAIAVPSTTAGTTVGATIDTGAPFCLTSVTAPGVWYTVTGTGGTLRATTCDAPGFGGSATYDTKISVYCGSCSPLSGLTCVTGNDDSCVGGTDIFRSTVTWCSQAGATYRILVHGFGSGTGTFSMNVSQTAPPTCGGAVSCLTTGACCIDLGGGMFNCVQTTASDCAAQGGAYQGDNTACPSVSYLVSACNGQFEDIENPDPMGNMGMALGLIDDNGVVLPLGFTFNFFGNPKTTVGVASNGYLTFGTSLTDFTNDPIPNTATPNDLIAPLWDDFNPALGGEVYAGTFGMAPNRAFVASWVGVPQFANSDSNTFQAILFENSGRISYRYLGFSPPSFAGDITVGVENATGTAGTSIDAATITNGQCINLLPDVPSACGSPIVVDVEPNDCPNLFNDLNAGLVQITLPGTASHPAADVVPSSVRMRRADGQGGSVALYQRAVNGELGTIGDVTTPFNGPIGSCDIGTPDGLDDLSFEVRTRDINDALGLDQLANGTQVTVEFSGLMVDGRVFTSQDVVTVDFEQHPNPVVVTFTTMIEDAAIEVTEDLNGDGLGFGPRFQRLYTPGTVVTVDAPSGQGTNVAHTGFVVDGIRLPGNPAQFTVGTSDMRVRVLYKVNQGSGTATGIGGF